MLNSKSKKLPKLRLFIKKNYEIITIILLLVSIIAPFWLGSRWNKNSKESGSGGSMINIPYKMENCDSFFDNINDVKWAIDKHWERDENNPRHFISKPNRKLGGPRMKYYENVSDNFRLNLTFKPVTKDEINIVIYIGDFYKLVLGDGNKDRFYLEHNGQRIPELRTEQEETRFLNRIKSNELVTLEINQSVPDSYIPGEPVTRTVVVSLFYTPDEIDNAGPVPDDGHVFQISDELPPDVVSRTISVGLVYSKNTIVTEFYCFKLEK